ncbi:EF-P beta-lysylation protein EpmB [Magnetofaba australis]|uniref:L-lysine 2,3-aminomutase n=1 Tax=Magnetofaba australis IT-1 TaxID=1434232 RepID=A0A1Y2K657_9PROT|nr:EF-P beta-lysylation protein EpmB [Magnetofaba australis]OSM02495.1 putative Lysine 2,3-aminomutase [Magnetofaba australis IT-1]
MNANPPRFAVSCLKPDEQAAHRAFPVRVSDAFAARINWDDPHDPLRAQVWPDARELDAAPGFTADPLAEAEATRAPGLIQKYAGRALLLAGRACPIHCRYCFRRHQPAAERLRGPQSWAPALAEIAEDASLAEIILSGGDPLMLEAAPLGELMAQLGRIAHVRRVRIHSRVPVADPARVDAGLVAAMAASGRQTVLVIHANHARELDAASAAALRRCREAGITLLNQSVLLAGVNDDAETLAELSEALMERGVLPYYLHQLDPVAGAAHFAVSDERALALMEALRARLPGYLVPKLVREIPGEAGKTALFSEESG